MVCKALPVLLQRRLGIRDLPIFFHFCCDSRLFVSDDVTFSVNGSVSRFQVLPRLYDLHPDQNHELVYNVLPHEYFSEIDSPKLPAVQFVTIDIYVSRVSIMGIVVSIVGSHLRIISYSPSPSTSPTLASLA